MIYPFTKSAKTSLANLAITEELLDKATDRIIASYKGKYLYDDLATLAAARFLLSKINNPYLTNRFAVTESKKYFSKLSDIPEEEVLRIAKELGIEYYEGKISIPSYLNFAPASPHYHLINRDIVKGKVIVTKQELLRIIQEATRKNLENLPKHSIDIDISRFVKRINVAMSSDQKTVKVKKGDYPPCILKILEEMSQHKNLPHHARWFLAVYLNAIGFKEDEIVSLYKALPDFKEKITRYQVKHIAKRKYKVPSCSTIMSYGLCCASCGISNPLLWNYLKPERKKVVINERRDL